MNFNSYHLELLIVEFLFVVKFKSKFKSKATAYS